MYGKFKDFLQNEIDQTKAAGLYKTEREITSSQTAAITVNQNGKTVPVLNFCANNYLWSLR